VSANERARCDVTAAASANRVAPVTSPRVGWKQADPDPGREAAGFSLSWGGCWKEGSLGWTAGRGARVEIIGGHRERADERAPEGTRGSAETRAGVDVSG